MKIGIDCSLVPGERAGVGQYTYNLVRALARIDRENDYILYPVFHHIFNRRYKAADFPGGGNFTVKFRHVPAAMLKLLWEAEPWPLTRERLLGRVDVLHSTTFCVPRLKGRTALVVTIYDVSFITHPECHVKANIDHCLSGTRAAVERADAIIAISNHTKHDLVRLFGAREEQVTVTHLAADESFRRVEDNALLEAVRGRHGLPDKFVLFIGSLEPRKNVKTLLRAYAALPAETRKKAKLVIAGGRGWLNEDIKDLVGSLGLSNDIHFTGYVAEQDLPSLYSLASVFVYPSLYEGFGLPILEAMACGCPVVTSNTSSMPEVAGGAALLAEPLDAASIAEAVNSVLADPALAARLSASGVKRAGMFSWEKTARETLDVYRRVLGRRA